MPRRHFPGQQKKTEKKTEKGARNSSEAALTNANRSRSTEHGDGKAEASLIASAGGARADRAARGV